MNNLSSTSELLATEAVVIEQVKKSPNKINFLYIQIFIALPMFFMSLLLFRFAREEALLTQLTTIDLFLSFLPALLLSVLSVGILCKKRQ